MSIHSLPDRGDPRVVCGLLAKDVLATLDAEQEIKVDSPFINFIRLLDTYRHDAFRLRRQRGVLARSDDAGKRPLTRNSMPKVREALAAAHAEVFGDDLTPDVVEFLIRSIEPCFRSDRTQLTNDEIDKTRRFIEALIQNLET